MVPAVQVTPGMLVDDERFPTVLLVGHVTIGRIWVTLRAFHPEAHVSPNPPRRLSVNESVRVRVAQPKERAGEMCVCRTAGATHCNECKGAVQR